MPSAESHPLLPKWLRRVSEATFYYTPTARGAHAGVTTEEPQRRRDDSEGTLGARRCPGGRGVPRRTEPRRGSGRATAVPRADGRGRRRAGVGGGGGGSAGGGEDGDGKPTPKLLGKVGDCIPMGKNVK